MAFELAAINPTSVPINLLNPRPGTKFGDRELMDPWEVVKWIAIFRLILPEALFRLCGGRVENLGELQATAVKAGLNGVMMGNFLTTLGNTPEQDREMFEELGLNVAARPTTAPTRAPTTARAGWTARRRTSSRSRDANAGDRRRLDVRLWDPSTPAALLAQANRAAPPRRRAEPRSRHGHVRARKALGSWTLAACAGAPAGQRSPGTARARSTASRCCCCAPTTTWGWPTIPAFARRQPRPRCDGVSAPALHGWCPGR